jgi:hypothetical protein
MMQAYIPSIKLFAPEILYHCKGVLAYDNHQSAGSKTTRLRNINTKNQYFYIDIPDITTFLLLDCPITKQPSYILEHLLADTAISTLFTADGRDFFHKLELYLSDNGLSDDIVAAQEQIKLFYDEKRSSVLELTAISYLSLISNLARGNDPSIVSSYLSSLGISGLVFKESGTVNHNAYFLFNPKKDAVIKGIIRVDIRESLVAS